jgi:hypothetical protein
MLALIASTRPTKIPNSQTSRTNKPPPRLPDIPLYESDQNGEWKSNARHAIALSPMAARW